MDPLYSATCRKNNACLSNMAARVEAAAIRICGHDQKKLSAQHSQYYKDKKSNDVNKIDQPRSINEGCAQQDVAKLCNICRTINHAERKLKFQGIKFEGKILHKTLTTKPEYTTLDIGSKSKHVIRVAGYLLQKQIKEN